MPELASNEKSRVSPIPAGYHTITPYFLVSDGDRFLTFVKQAFDAAEVSTHRDSEGLIRNSEVRLGDSMLMFAQARPEWPAMPMALYLYVPDTDATYKSALESGATSTMAPADQFYGDRNAGVKDPLGNQWWIATHIEDVPEEEMKRRMAGAEKKSGAETGSTSQIGTSAVSS